ncbi:LOW QUALITY PROTEIN: CD109 antigen-like [Bufo gargarizans]|uniref:LOW QUALITY PROTEIN: CD109 antigen-like n=1 Tax=Bufo gargarizans TaxID=30331 RepID=UPI001CF5F167|nr:LOW QUALITY PROTEIN: CD109 antigen-like [Bufo gargarizans]
MHPLMSLSVLLSIFLVTCDGRPSYYITAPSYIIPGENTTLAVHWFGDKYSEITVSAGIMTTTSILVNVSQVFHNDAIGTISIPAIPADPSTTTYTLAVIGCGENMLAFSLRMQVKMQTKSVSIFIQIDKTAYKPGESVRIRVISVNRDLRPHKGDVDLIIKDPKNIIVQQWLKMKPVVGIVSKEYLLSDRVLLGDWKIQAKSDKRKVSQKFDVILDIPTFYIDSKMLSLTGTVTAKYASDTPVKGNVTIAVKPLYSLEGLNEVNKTFKISGSKNFSFTRAELQNVVNREGMNVTVSVTEELTGIEVNAESYILTGNSEYRIKLISQQPAFGPGLNFTAKVKVERIDDRPLSQEERDETVAVKISQRRSSSDSFTTMLQYSIPESGIIDLEFPVLQSIQWITINVDYQNVSEMFNSNVVYTRNPFIDIQILNSSLKVGEEFNIQVTTYLEIPEIYYVVVSKGLVVFTGRNSTNFSLIPEASWAPSAQLTVYWLNISNNFADIMQISKTLSIKGTLDNKVSLSWSKNKAHPSEHVFLSVNVKEPNSLVYLRVMDKSSMLLRGGTDLTTNKVYDELASYDQGPPASLTDAVIQNKYEFFSIFFSEYTPRSRENVVLPPRHKEIPLPEIWIWQDTNLSSSLTEKHDVTVPDRNTSWVATAFVISERLGLGVAEEFVEISVFKPFLMSLNLPYSVTRGEQFIVEVILSNSLFKNLQVLVSLELHDSFEIIVPKSIYKGSVASQHSITVPSQGGTRVLFPIRPRKLGNIPITVKATSDAASDVLNKMVLVKAEGVKYFYSQTALLELIGHENTTKTVSKNISFMFPNDVVPGSEQAYITVIGDLLGPSINVLESLIEMPNGCGEQNMINFAPNIYILQYLIATNQIKSDIRERAINFMERGYQKELTYRRYDGSFSAFGNSDSSGSTWLSAFVFRCFLQARTFIYINPTVLNETVEWLMQYQDLDTGIFSEPGRVIYAELQGGQNGPITLTAYILTSLLEDKYYRTLYASRVQKAVQYLEKKFDEGIASNFMLSIVVYALSLANSSKAHDALTQLNSRANTTEGTKFWSKSSNYSWQPRTTDIETAAYALFSYHQQGKIMDGIPVMKWLSQQRNHLGGYSSTQDTIMALQALSKFLLLVPSYETSLTLAVTGPDSYVHNTFHVNNKNLLVLQSQQIQVSQPLLVNATADGRGLVIFQLNVMYNRKSSSRRRRNTVIEPFLLDVTVKDETNNIHRLSVDVCMSFQGKGNESSMALLDVGYLSGFTLSPEGVISVQSLKLVEPKEGKVYLYLDSVTKEELCISIPMIRFAKVANSQDAVIKVSDYYNPEMSTTRTYNSLTMQRISTCDYCGFNCTQCTSNELMLPLGSKTTVPTFSLLWFCIIAIYYVVLMCILF